MKNKKINVDALQAEADTILKDAINRIAQLVPEQADYTFAVSGAVSRFDGRFVGACNRNVTLCVRDADGKWISADGLNPHTVPGESKAPAPEPEVKAEPEEKKAKPAQEIQAGINQQVLLGIFGKKRMVQENVSTFPAMLLADDGKTAIKKDVTFVVDPSFCGFDALNAVNRAIKEKNSNPKINCYVDMHGSEYVLRSMAPEVA